MRYTLTLGKQHCSSAQFEKTHSWTHEYGKIQNHLRVPILYLFTPTRGDLKLSSLLQISVKIIGGCQVLN